ncbi:MAG: hypothetical protein AB7P12_00945 [Alphaproteobacteria bacterium]
MSSSNQPGSDTRVKEYEPSRPGIKFLLCVIAAVIAVTVLILTR